MEPTQKRKYTYRTRVRGEQGVVESFYLPKPLSQRLRRAIRVKFGGDRKAAAVAAFEQLVETAAPQEGVTA